MFNWISLSLNIDKSILNAVFNAKYNKTNENKVMNRKLIRLTESDIHRIVKESVNRILEASRQPKKKKGDTWARDVARIENGKGNFVNKLKRKPEEWLQNADTTEWPKRTDESILRRIVKESVNRVLNEVWDIDDNGIVDYD